MRYIKYRLSNGTFVKIFAPGWMPGPINTEAQAQALSNYNFMIEQVRYAYNDFRLFNGHHVTMVEERL